MFWWFGCFAQWLVAFHSTVVDCLEKGSFGAKQSIDVLKIMSCLASYGRCRKELNSLRESSIRLLCLILCRKDVCVGHYLQVNEFAHRFWSGGGMRFSRNACESTHHLSWVVEWSTGTLHQFISRPGCGRNSCLKWKSQPPDIILFWSIHCWAFRWVWLRHNLWAPAPSTQPKDTVAWQINGRTDKRKMICVSKEWNNTNTHTCLSNFDSTACRMNTLLVIMFGVLIRNYVDVVRASFFWEKDKEIRHGRFRPHFRPFLRWMKKDFSLI